MALLVLILAFHVVWCRFRMLRRYLAYNSSVHELARVYSLLRVVSARCSWTWSYSLACV